jgi:hypothetical protein
MPPVTDLRDTRVLIPRTRRALEGIAAAGSGFDPTTYGDDAVNSAVADSIANLLLYSGSFFGATLEVVERDDHYQSPIAWRTSRELTEAEASLVALQAALDHVYVTLVATKQSETIRNEGQEWSYTISANVLSERLKGIRADRDRALDAIAGQNAGMEDWISWIQARDAETSAMIEPYVDGSSTGGQLLDPRGFY